MKRWLLAVVLSVVPGSLIGLVLWHAWRTWRARRWRDSPNYRDAIQAWAPDTPLALPPIQPLKVRRWWQARLIETRASGRR